MDFHPNKLRIFPIGVLNKAIRREGLLLHLFSFVLISYKIENRSISLRCDFIGLPDFVIEII
jgi:hypothetical protein